MSDSSALTAPALFGMQSRGAKLLAAGLVGALFLSVTADRQGVSSLPLLLLGLTVVSVGVGVTVSVRTDPMPGLVAWAVAGTGPAGCVLTCLAMTDPIGNPNQLNALGAGVAICSFLGVRGRTATAWWAFVAMVAVLGCWSIRSGLGLYGLVFSAPNAAVLGMATLFAVVVRPTAAQIRRLREQAIDEAESMAAAEARIAELDGQRAELRRVAWPTLSRIADGECFTASQVAEIRLTEAQLRDSVRARGLSSPPIAQAARSARSRGVAVAMFDDGGMDTADHDAHDALSQQVVKWLDQTTSGSITVRIHPPGRPVVVSVVALLDDGTSMRIDIDATGAIRTR